MTYRAGSQARAARRALREDLSQRQRSVLLSWLSFTGTFAAVRGITYSIRSGRGPFRNISAKGEHLHHYLWGIGLLTGVGAVAVHGESLQRRHRGVALSYGTGLALIIDEFALLLDLRDVYWARQGRISVDLGVGAIAVTGSYLAALPLQRALARRLGEQERDGAQGPRGEQERGIARARHGARARAVGRWQDDSRGADPAPAAGQPDQLPGNGGNGENGSAAGEGRVLS